MSTPTNDAALSESEWTRLWHALRACRLEDAPISLLGASDEYHVRHMTTPAVAQIKADAIAAERARVLAILDAPETREATADRIRGDWNPGSRDEWADQHADAALATLRDHIGGQA